LTRSGEGPGTQAQRARLSDVIDRAFHRSQPRTRDRLRSHAEFRTHRAGETVVAQGEEARTVLVLDGHVAFRRTAADGRELIPRVVSSGELASLMPLTGRPAVVEAVALAPSVVALWPGHDLATLAAEDAGFAVDLLEHVLLTFEAVIERLDGFLYQNAMRRVARVLHMHADVLFGEGVLARRFLPALVGTSHEMTRRVLRSLESHGVVARVGPDRLELLDPHQLARTAAPPVTS
jgi:CRP-like cAMP-binding protein